MTSATDTDERRPSASRRRITWVVAALVPVVAAAVAVALVVGKDDASPTAVAAPPSSAPMPPTPGQDVVSRAIAAVDGFTRLTGTVKIIRAPYVTGDGKTVGAAGTLENSFVISSQGNYRIESADGTRLAAYDAVNGTYRSCSKESSGWVCGGVDGVVDVESTSQGNDLAGLSNIASTLHALASTSPRISESNYEGRRTWTVEGAYSARKSTGGPADSAAVVIDQQTAFPVKMTTSVQGRPQLTVEMTQFKVNAEATPGDLTLQTPPDARIENAQSSGFVRVAGSDVDAKARRKSHDPQPLLSGWKPAEVSYAGSVRTDDGERRDAVVKTYRRGLESFHVQSIANPPGSPLAADPNAARNEVVVGTERTTLTGGALAGLRGNLVMTPSQTRFWGASDVLLGIEGDLGADDLLTVANSLS